ncbi:hypothetical protein [Amycolatopsis sp. WQ 127309]|uniref:hypothetical protein n=1 Tax=Amycolatopsis sp. WQ 127309 TaxID=2932773 RepID=UPI001FF6C02B|nr:hypothetical protein [Amycolatopsis sp. WQ 127309]UOZ10542.1 hypothetical protein MUY22_20665 [Amycolatopsis sp. WQ 127309]
MKLALDVNETARAEWQVDEAIDAASREIERCTHRVFYPWTGTRYFDWPSPQNGTSYRLWLEEDELISATRVTSGTVEITLDQYNLEPVNQGPPFDRLELLLDGPATFGQSDSHQHDVAITGVFAGCALDESVVGVLASAVGSTINTAITVTDPWSVGVGSILRVESERMLVTERSWTASTQTVQTDALTVMKNDQVVKVTDGTVFSRGETVMIDAEQLRVDEITGNSLIVTRAWNGSTLAGHDVGATIYRGTLLTVTRGALGTTAATHSISAPVYRFNPPAQVRSLARAQALDTILQERSGYARVVGSGDNARGASGVALSSLWARVEDDLGRIRLGVV